MWSAMHATEVSWLNLKIVCVLRAVRFLFSFALHSFLIKQEKRMNKEFSHWFPDKALFASCRVRARPGSPVRKFSRRTPTSDYDCFLCIPLLFVTNWFITSVKYPIFRQIFSSVFLSCKYILANNFACWRRSSKGRISALGLTHIAK